MTMRLVSLGGAGRAAWHVPGRSAAWARFVALPAQLQTKDSFMREGKSKVSSKATGSFRLSIHGIGRSGCSG